MRRARLAYIRTLGKLEASSTAKVNEKLTSTLGATLEGLSKMEVTAQQEMEFAETLKLIAEDLSIEEREDELVDLGAELSDGVHGVVTPLGSRFVGSVVQARNQGYLRLRQLFQGDVGRQVHLVFIFDELDKLDDGTPPPREAPGSALTKTADVIRQLKILFSTTGLSAIVVGGVVAEERWLDEITEHDPLLRSVFSRHVYVPQLGLSAMERMFRSYTLESAQTPAAITFWTRGRYKQLLRARGAVLAGRLDDEFPHVPHEVLAKLLGRFGETDVKAANKAPRSASEALAAASDLESLAVTLLATTSPITRREAFGADVLRTLLLRVAVECLDPMMASEEPPPEQMARLRDRLGELLPSTFIGPVLDRVKALVLAAVGPAKVP